MLLVSGFCVACTHGSHQGNYHKLPEAKAQMVEKHYYVAFDQEILLQGEEEELMRSFQDVDKSNVASISVILDNNLQSERLTVIRNILTKQGFNVDSIVSDTALKNDGLIIVKEWDGFVSGCPDWSKDNGTDYSNGYEANFGCSTQMNLAAMVVNPNDLNKGRTMDAADAHQGVRAIQRYRSGEIIDIRRDDGILSNE